MAIMTDRSHKFFKSSMLLLACATLLGTLLPGCGGGGGGGGFVGAAITSVDASPTQIDTADRTEVTSYISEVNDSGIVLKFLYPKDLTYVLGSAQLRVGDNDIDISPTTNPTKGNDTYLVFVFGADTFGEDRAGSITFFLQARSENSDAKVEIDADVRQEGRSADQQFNVDAPNFGAEDSAQIVIED